MVSRAGLPALLPAAVLIGTAGIAAIQTTPAVAPQVAPAPQPAAPMVQPVAASPADAAIAASIAEWRSLRQTDGLPFQSYAGFVRRNPGWPGEQGFRRTAEGRIQPGITSPSEVVAFFDAFPPLTNAGQARFAEALQALGRRDEAREAAAKAWTSGSLTDQDEARLLPLFGSGFTTAQHDERMDRLLWAGRTSAALRQLAYTSPDRRALFDARLAFRTRAADAAARAAPVMERGMGDAGFVADRATWLRASGNSVAARELLAQPRRLTVRPSEVEKWYELLLTNARAAGNDGQWALAYAIASGVDDALPEGAVVREQSLGVRDDYTSLVWLAGQVALERRNRPQDAERMFDLYARAAQSPQTQSKGHYWAGRAARSGGSDPNAHWEQAARHPDQFYGQLAMERLGRTQAPPAADSGPAPTAEQRRAYNDRPVVRAARWLGRAGLWQDQTAFVRQIAADATSDADHGLAAELAASIGRPDLAVMVGRSARSNGRADYLASAYPQVPVPGTLSNDWTMIHAIARQESQFDRAAISSAGARGLMQLMPGTAREVSTRLGLGYRPDALTSDIGYNVSLGSSYYNRMMASYGRAPLALAAYNAGPGNVNRWLRENGDPRTGSVDMITWIERIPFAETRGYVQRVLENAVVYDTLNPGRARRTSDAPLSAYLGTSPRG